MEFFRLVLEPDKPCMTILKVSRRISRLNMLQGPHHDEGVSIWTIKAY